MNGDIKVQFKMDDGSLSDEYSIMELLDKCQDDIFEEMHEKYGGCDGNCTNESVNHCECGNIFDENKIVEIIIPVNPTESSK